MIKIDNLSEYRNLYSDLLKDFTPEQMQVTCNSLVVYADEYVIKQLITLYKGSKTKLINNYSLLEHHGHTPFISISLVEY